MTIGEAVGRVMHDRPSEANESELRMWLWQLDLRFWHEQVLRHEGGDAVEEPAYDAETPADTVLLIPSPYDEVYIHHLYACIDYRLGEMDRYNNDAIMYRDAWKDACKAYRRTHMPLETRLHHVVYGRRLTKEAGADASEG